MRITRLFLQLVIPMTITFSYNLNLSAKELAFDANQNCDEISIRQKLQFVGSTAFSFLWWDVYNAELYTDSGSYDYRMKSPLLIKLTYQRQISRKELLDETLAQWKKQNVQSSKLSSWIEQLQHLWPNIQKNDSLAFYIDLNQNTHFYYNQVCTGSIFDPEFSNAFKNIWLASNSSYPKNTLELTGKQ